MDDMIVLAVGRQLIELCIQREQLTRALNTSQQQLQQAQARLKEQAKAQAPEAPPED